MKTVKKIFLTDVKNLVKNMFALIIAVGVCFLPALYAWFNIYSNWDPYGNTGSLQMAAVCLDKGYTDEEGSYLNVGDNIMEEMKQNDKVDWIFVDSQEEALKGVKAGDYYAALVIEEDFTYNMYNMFVKTDQAPTLHFYQNQKKNPVANKISDTIVSTLENSIDEEFIKVMTTELFADANVLHEEIEKDGGIDAFIKKLENVNADLKQYQNVISQIVAGNAVLSTGMEGATADAGVLKEKTKSSSQNLAESAQSVQTSQDTLATYRTQVNQTVDVMLLMLNNMQDMLEQGKLAGDVQAMSDACNQAKEDATHLINNLTALQSQGALTDPTKGTLEQLINTTKELQKMMEALGLQGSSTSTADSIKEREAAMAEQLDTAIANINTSRSTINSQLIPQLNDSLDNLEQIINNASVLMGDMSGVLSGMENVFGSLKQTVDITNTSLLKTQKALGEISNRITKAIEKTKEVEDGEKMEVLLNTLAGDPDIYGQFFSDPVEIESVGVYPVENYGSAVAPFYTTLSIWVGVIILAAIVKVKPRKSLYPEAKPSTLFFGRGLFFIVMSQIQTVITVLGNLFLLRIQCLHPMLFWFTCALTSLTFTLLIYALVYTFGDVGKAVAVVVLVLQIAGSSGTYPIELLPTFFQKVYILFPFPYAINAMRECICGLYERDIVIYILELLIFILPALVVGLLLRIPFENLNHYMEERMEDTEIM